MSGVFSFFATILALVLLLSPFIFLDVTNATIVAFITGTTISFILGCYVGTLSKENPYKSGLKYAKITIAGAIISYLIGDFLGHYFNGS